MRTWTTLTHALSFQEPLCSAVSGHRKACHTRGRQTVTGQSMYSAHRTAYTRTATTHTHICVLLSRQPWALMLAPFACSTIFSPRAYSHAYSWQQLARTSTVRLALPAAQSPRLAPDLILILSRP